MLLKIIIAALVIISVISVASFVLISEQSTEQSDVPTAKTIPKSEEPKESEIKIIIFEPTDTSGVCASLSCPLSYDDEKCGVGFFVKANGEYVTQGEKYMVSDPEIVKNWDNCR